MNRISKLFVLAAAIWVTERFNTIDDVTIFLNTLTPAQAAEAKVVDVTFWRSPAGPFTAPYAVIYKSEKPEHQKVAQEKAKKKKEMKNKPYPVQNYKY